MGLVDNGSDPFGAGFEIVLDMLQEQGDISKDKEEIESNSSQTKKRLDQKITTRLFAAEAKKLSESSEDWCDFYEIDLKDRRITIAEGSDLPLSEDELAIIMVSEKEGEKPVVMACGEHAEKIRKSKLRLHELSHKGKEVIRVLEGKDITIKSLDEEQYRRIFGVAIRAIQLMSEQSKEEEARKAAKESLGKNRSVEVLTGTEHRGDVQEKYPDLKAMYAKETTEEHTAEQWELEREGIKSERRTKEKKRKRDKEYDLKMECYKAQDAKKARLQESNKADDIKKERGRK